MRNALPNELSFTALLLLLFSCTACLSPENFWSAAQAPGHQGAPGQQGAKPLNTKGDSNEDRDQSQSAKTAEQVNGEEAVEIDPQAANILELINKQPNYQVDWEPIYKQASHRVSTGHKDQIIKLELLSQERAISLSSTGEVLIWDLPAGRAAFLCEVTGEFGASALSIRTGLIAVARKQRIDLFDLHSCVRIAALTRLKTRISSLSFHPAGTALLLGGVDSRSYRWNFALEARAKSLRDREHILERYFGHAAPVSAVEYFPYGRTFFTGDLRGVISAYSDYEADVFGGAYDDFTAFGNRGYTERVKRMKHQAHAATAITALKVGNDGQYLFVALQDGVIEAWKVRGFTLKGTLPAHAGFIYDFDILAESRLLSSCARDGRVKIWSYETSLDEEQPLKFRMLAEFDFPGARQIAIHSADRLYIGTADGKVVEAEIKALENPAEVDQSTVFFSAAEGVESSVDPVPAEQVQDSLDAGVSSLGASQ